MPAHLTAVAVGAHGFFKFVSCGSVFAKPRGHADHG
jgi:hypothetical protein